MKIKTLILSAFLSACATGPIYQAPIVSNPATLQMAPLCVPMQTVTSQSPNGEWTKEKGTCGNVQFVAKEGKALTLWGVAKVARGDVVYIVDILNETPVTFKARLVPQSFTGVGIHYEDVFPWMTFTTMGKQRIVVRGKVAYDTKNIMLEIQAPEKTVVGGTIGQVY